MKIYLTDLNELSKFVHQANIKWWQNPETGKPILRNVKELLALVVSELSECLEGERKGCADDKLPHRPMAEVELADAKIRILDFAAGFGVTLIRRDDKLPTPENKGQALFEIMDCVFLASRVQPDVWLSRAIVKIEAYAEKWGYDLNGAFVEKMAYNVTREDHTHEARKIAGGKQF